MSHGLVCSYHTLSDFFQCDINHGVLKVYLDPIRALFDDVKRKALMRLEYEGLHKAEAITTAGTRFHNDPSGFAMDRYAYYVCFKCKKHLLHQCTTELIVFVCSTTTV